MTRRGPHRQSIELERRARHDARGRRSSGPERRAEHDAQRRQSSGLVARAARTAASIAGVLAVSALGSAACTTDHDLFAAGGSGGATENGGHSGSGGVSYMTGGDAAVDAAVGTGGRKGPVEPPGPLAVSIVNGVTDAPWISLCFTKVTDGVESSLHGKPFPSASLAYGKSLTVSSLPGVDFASDAVRPYVIAASPDAISGLDCASIFVIAGVLVRESAPDGAPSNAVDGSVADAARDASFDVSGDGRPSGLDAANPVDARTTPDGAGSSRDAAPAEGGPAANHGKVPVPIIRVSPLYVIPAGTFTAARHYLFALGGCLGGPGITDPSERSVCGENYSATHPTLIPVLLTLSRITTSGRVGIQFVDASPPVRAADLHLTSKGLSTLTVVTNSVIGAIRPEPPNTARPSTDYAPSDHIQIFADASPQPIYDAPWSKTLAVGDLSSLADGHTYTLLLVGPYPGFSQREWWNDPLVTVIENDR